MKLILSHQLVLMIAITLGRLMGFLREILMGKFVGVGLEADALVILLTLSLIHI